MRKKRLKCAGFQASIDERKLNIPPRGANRYPYSIDRDSLKAEIEKGIEVVNVPVYNTRQRDNAGEGR